LVIADLVRARPIDSAAVGGCGARGRPHVLKMAPG
jgi:hypothetical protein